MWRSASAEEDAPWDFYLASASATRDGFTDAYRAVYATFSRLALPAITLSNIRLVPANDPIAVDAAALRDRYPARIPTRFGPRRLGGVAIEEVYIYPRLDRGLNRGEVLQAVTALLDRADAISSITLRDGSTVRASVDGIRRAGQDVTITLKEVATGHSRDIPAEEIRAIK